MNIISNKILDRRFTNLIRKSLKAGYFQFREYNSNIAGTPQGSIVSPLLANIFLHQLDVYIESLKLEFDKGDKPGTSKEYKALRPELRRAEYHKDIPEIKRLTNKLRKIDHTDFHDPHYKRLAYIRYADD